MYSKVNFKEPFLVDELLKLISDNYISDISISKYSSSNELQNITVDSRQVDEGSIFVAIKGVTVDGHSYIPEVIKKGAKLVIADRESYKIPDSEIETSIIIVDDSRKVLSQILIEYFSIDFNSFNLIGVTGTNGKTTTAWVISHLFSLLGINSSSIGTLGVFAPFSNSIPSDKLSLIKEAENIADSVALTTPLTMPLIKILNNLYEATVKVGCLETSSHALELGRLLGLEFHSAIFTNLTRDHLDFHGSEIDYAGAKYKLFVNYLQLNGFAIINTDDPIGREYCLRLESDRPDVNLIRYGTDPTNECYLIETQEIETGQILKLELKNINGLERTNFELNIPFQAKFNAFNCMATLCAVIAFDNRNIEILDLISQAFQEVPQVNGRLEKFQSRGITVYVDYAHTPDALESVLKSMLSSEATHQVRDAGRVITVFGCGGDRDAGKRPLMMGAALKYSDLVFVTSDNPRTENPDSIISDIIRYVSHETLDKKVNIEVDREKAIAQSISTAKAGDIIVIAGKGHENYQILGAEKIYFSDQEVVKKYL